MRPTQQSGLGPALAAPRACSASARAASSTKPKDRGLKSKPVHGHVSFTTMWPGWYTSRAIQHNVRVQTLSHHGATIAGYTTQIFFSDADNDHVLTGTAPHTRSPKTSPLPTRTTPS